MTEKKKAFLRKIGARKKAAASAAAFLLSGGA
jgi:hypothetical protein